jgi:RHS repeat-associated protein
MIGIEYNILNLPAKIFAGSDTISYVYTASGERLAARLTPPSISSLTIYRSVMVYGSDGGSSVGEPVEPTLLYILQPEGLIARAEGTNGEVFTYKYFKTDHTGSTRVLLAANNGVMQVEQSTDYYPFGLAWETNNLNQNRYLYSGKEIEDALLNGSPLAIYYFGARYYNPTLGRWFNVDPALQFTNPYLYCANSPGMYIDPNGEFITFSFGKNGFSIGLNFGFGGFGINVGWRDGGSLGFYTEVGPRIGPVGVTMSHSYNYGFRSGSWSRSTGVSAGVSAGPVSVGVGGSYTTDISTGQGGFGWGVGVGYSGFSNSSWGISPYVGYGSGGWNLGVGGYAGRPSYEYPLLAYEPYKAPEYTLYGGDIPTVMVDTRPKAVPPAGAVDYLKRVPSIAAYTGIAADAAKQTLTSTRVGSNIAYTLAQSRIGINIANGLKPLGSAAIGVGIGADIYLSAEGEQSWGETGLNTAVTGVAVGIGGGPGIVIQLHYIATKSYINYYRNHPEEYMENHIPWGLRR